MKYLLSLFGWLVCLFSASFLVYSFYIPIEYYWFVTNAHETQGEITDIKIHETNTGSLPGVVSRQRAMRGDLGGYRKVNILLCTVEYLDNKGGKQTGYLTNSSSSNLGDIVKFSYLPNNPKLLRSPKNEQPWMLAFYSFVFSVFSLIPGIVIFGYLGRKKR